MLDLKLASALWNLMLVSGLAAACARYFVHSAARIGSLTAETGTCARRRSVRIASSVTAFSAVDIDDLDSYKLNKLPFNLNAVDIVAETILPLNK